MGRKRAAIYSLGQWGRIWERLGYKPSKGKADEIETRLALGRARGHRRLRDPKRRLRFLTRERNAWGLNISSLTDNIIGNAVVGNFEKVLRHLYREAETKHRQTNRLSTNWGEGLSTFIDCLPAASQATPETREPTQASAKAPSTTNQAAPKADPNFLIAKPSQPKKGPGDELLERPQWDALEGRKAQKPPEAPSWVKVGPKNFKPVVVNGHIYFFVHGVKPSNREIRVWIDSIKNTAQSRGLEYDPKTVYLGDTRQAAVWFLKRFSREAVRVYALNRRVPFHPDIAERIGGALAETMPHFNPPLFLEQLLNGYRNETTSDIRGPAARQKRLEELVVAQAEAAGIDATQIRQAARRFQLQGLPSEEAARQAIKEYQEKRKQAARPSALAGPAMASPTVPAPASARLILPAKEKMRHNGPATAARPPESPRQPAIHRLVLPEEHFWKPEEDWLNGLRDHRPGLVEALTTPGSRLNQFLDTVVRDVLPKRTASNPETRRKYAFGIVNSILQPTWEAQAMHMPLTWFLDKSRARRAPGGYMNAIFARLVHEDVFQPHQAGRKYHSYELNFKHPIAQLFLR